VAAVTLLAIVAGSGCAGLVARSVLVRFVFAAERLLSVAGNAIAVGQFLEGATAKPPPPPADATRVILRHEGQGRTINYHYDIRLDDDMCFLIDGDFVDSHTGDTVTLSLSGPIVVGVVKCGLFDKPYSAKQVDKVPQVAPEPSRTKLSPTSKPVSAECPTPTPTSTATADTATATDATSAPTDMPAPPSAGCTTPKPSPTPTAIDVSPEPAGQPESSSTTPFPAPEPAPSPTRSPESITPATPPEPTSVFSSPSSADGDTSPPPFGDYRG
jgi:hypothetical protein